MKNVIPVGIRMKPTTAEFFKNWRENYEWPYNVGRSKSEKQIHKLQVAAQTVLRTQNIERLAEVLVAIHKWKTKNRGNRSTRYGETLARKQTILEKLFEHLPITFDATPNEIITFLELLDMDYSRMPVCSAQLSFLSERQFPILDKFIGQVMSQTFDPLLLKSKDYGFQDICLVLGNIDFRIVKGTKGKRSLATQGNSNKVNRELYATELIPQLDHAAQQLNDLGIHYTAVDGSSQRFNCVDVEMAIFAFATHNQRYFESF